MGYLIERNIFNKRYDDPYRVLAAHIVAVYSPIAIRRILTNSSYVKALISKEARQMDISGTFLDCIDQEIISNDRLRQKNVYLKQLGHFYYSQLDLARLRKEIEMFVDELGIKLPD